MDGMDGWMVVRWRGLKREAECIKERTLEVNIAMIKQ